MITDPTNGGRGADPDAEKELIAIKGEADYNRMINTMQKVIHDHAMEVTGVNYIIKP